MDATTLVNGKPSHTLDVRDRGLAYGDGVFETIALKQGQVQLWQGHQQRLVTGLMTLGIVVDEAAAVNLVNSIVDDIKIAYLLFGHPQGVIKITITRLPGDNIEHDTDCWDNLDTTLSLREEDELICNLYF